MRLFKSKFFAYAFIFTGILLLSACEEPDLTPSPSSLTFEANETGEKTVTIKTNASDWKIQGVSENWIDASRKSDPDILYVRVPVYEETNSSRTGTITISASRRGKSSSEDIFIEQLKKPINTLSVTPTSLAYEANETGNKTIQVMTDAPSWNAEKNPSDTWLTLTKQDQTLVVNVSGQNSISTSRSVEITFTAGNAPPLPFIVTQGGKNSLSLSPNSPLSFDPEESSQSLNVTTNASSWNASITSGTAWLSTSTNDNILTVTVARNNTSSSRTGGFRVTAGSADPVNYSVTQSADNLTISPTSLSFTATSTAVQNVTITTNVANWSFTNNASWLTVNQNGNTLSVNPTSPNSGSARNATITITAGYATSQTLSVSQAAATVNTLTVTPTAGLTFAYNATTSQSFTITTDAESWTASKSNSDTWFGMALGASGQLVVTPLSQNTSDAPRTANILFEAGNAAPVYRSVTQNIPIPDETQMPIRVLCNYSANATILEHVEAFGASSWTGQIVPNVYSNWIEINNISNIPGWVPIWLDWQNGRFQLDVTTRIDIGDYDLYWCIGTISGNNLTMRPGTAYTVNYNQSTRVIDFSGTYQGLPVCIFLLPRDKQTGDWYNGFAGAVYRDLKLTITTSPATGAQTIITKGTIINPKGLNIEIIESPNMRIEK